MVIVALGDSTTAGTPLFKSPIEAPPQGEGDVESQYAYWLMRKWPDWQVLNRGVNGERTDQIAARFARDVLGVDAAAVVIIAGVNDVYQGKSVGYVTQHLRQLYELAFDAGLPVIAGSIVPYNTATVDQNARMHDVNAWIRREAALDPRLHFVDTRAACAAPDNPDRLAGSPDELHPDVAGYRQMAGVIEAGILRALDIPTSPSSSR
jgi:lysophospholipase L1-like esterase